MARKAMAHSDGAMDYWFLNRLELNRSGPGRGLAWFHVFRMEMAPEVSTVSTFERARIGDGFIGTRQRLPGL